MVCWISVPLVEFGVDGCSEYGGGVCRILHLFRVCRWVILLMVLGKRLSYYIYCMINGRSIREEILLTSGVLAVCYGC